MSSKWHHPAQHLGFFDVEPASHLLHHPPHLLQNAPAKHVFNKLMLQRQEFNYFSLVFSKHVPSSQDIGQLNTDKVFLPLTCDKTINQWNNLNMFSSAPPGSTWSFYTTFSSVQQKYDPFNS